MSLIEIKGKMYELFINNFMLKYNYSQLDQLQEVVLRGMTMYGVGPHAAELRQHTPNIQELDISATLVSSWLSVSQITECLPKLTSLNVR
jgi:hypothetical protein